MLIFSGCARHQWSKRGASNLEIEKDIYECKSQSANLYPPKLVTTDTVMVQPTRNCSSVSHGAAQICRDDPVAKWSYMRDENEDNRNASVKQCLIDRGYEWVIK